MTTEHATRCPNCATVFRVAPAQLQAYEGWVRCGRCAEVFNAEKCLVALDAPVRPEAAPPTLEARTGTVDAMPSAAPDFDLSFDLPPAPAPQPAATLPPAMARGGSGLAPAYSQEDMVERAVKVMQGAPGQSGYAAEPTPEPDVRQRHPVDPALSVRTEQPVVADDAWIEQRLEAGHGASRLARIGPLVDGGATPPIEWRPASEAATLAAREAGEPVSAHHDFVAEPRWPTPGSAADPPLALDDDLDLTAKRDPPALDDEDQPVQAMPSFVRQADRAARWRSPRVTLLLAGLCTLGVVGLLAQGAFEYRDSLAARLEFTRPALAQGCALLRCTVSAPRLLDAEGVSVESSGLVRVEKTNTYKLSVALRNRAATIVALPALELSLTDAQGKLMARRVLRGADFGVTQGTVAAGRDLSLQATMQTAFATANGAPQEAVAGYTIELFYP
jgi:predicted Zn finger-like uncharacterized protein